MSFLAGALRILLILFVVRLVARAVASVFRPRSRTRDTPKMAGVDLVRDRVCNTFLPRDRALTVEQDGATHHFCSETCRSRFLEGRRAAS